jgi:hypothetical protein
VWVCESIHTYLSFHFLRAKLVFFIRTVKFDIFTFLTVPQSGDS